ncbi:MAG TPA: NUDIX hydrolase, partial [Firmicutes bacterium]|nr:NUDIX hydrolase [Bacillota bacterium]
NQDGRLVLVRQYRHPIGRELLEIPAGKLDGGEPPEQCAVRELSEETGLQPIELLELGKIVTAPGFCNEGITLFFARGVPQQGAKA